MELTVGTVLEGKVKSITNFGAFISLPENKTGMVHISEVANTYVKEITDHISEGQTVKVKVLSIGEDGKISLSIKKVETFCPSMPKNKITKAKKRIYFLISMSLPFPYIPAAANSGIIIISAAPQPI